MFSLFDWGKLYDQSIESRLLTLECETITVDLPVNTWAWFDFFRAGEPAEAFAKTMLDAAAAAGNTPATAIGVLVNSLIQAHRQESWDDGPFAPLHADRLAKAILYLPVVDDHLTARDDPAYWWELFFESARRRARILAFEDETREPVLPERIWMLLDLWRGGRPDAAYGAYVAIGDEDPEAAARALRALAKAHFTKLRSEGSHPAFQAHFIGEMERADALLNA